MKVLVRTPNWLGDAVMALPAIEAIFSHEDTQLIIVAHRGVAAVFDGYDVRETASGLDTKIFRDAAADKLILLTNSFSTALSGYRAGIPQRFGYAMHWRSALLTHALPRNSGAPVHQIDEYCHLAAYAGYPAAGATDHIRELDHPITAIPRLPARSRFDPAYREPGMQDNYIPSKIEELTMSGGPVDKVDEDYIVIAPGAKYGSAKCWPGFGGLVTALASEGKRVVIIGSSGESNPIKPLNPDLSRLSKRGSVENMIGKTTLSQALDIIAHAKTVVSNDSGVAHAATALGRKTVVVFGPTNAARTAPRGCDIVQGIAECAPCGLRRCPIDHRCMRSVSVEDVLGVTLPICNTVTPE